MEDGGSALVGERSREARAPGHQENREVRDCRGREAIPAPGINLQEGAYPLENPPPPPQSARLPPAQSLFSSQEKQRPSAGPRLRDPALTPQTLPTLQRWGSTCPSNPPFPTAALKTGLRVPPWSFGVGLLRAARRAALGQESGRRKPQPRLMGGKSLDNKRCSTWRHPQK